jgi:hypothetical protein
LLSIIGKGRAGRRPGYDVFITTNCYSQRFHLLSCRGEERRRRGGSKLRCSNCYARMTRKVTSSRSKRRRRKRRRRRGKMRRR